MNRKQRKKIKQPVAKVKNRMHLYAIVLLSISIFLAYSNSLNGPWVMDDVDVINRPVGMKDIHDFIGFRKVAYITFLLNQTIAPFSPANFRLFNILLHILNAALVYVLAYRTTPLCPPLVRGNPSCIPPLVRGDRGGSSGNLLATTHNHAFYIALLSSIVFGLHPININAVAYITQRMASLATFFILLSLLCYSGAYRVENRLNSALLYIMSGIFLIAAIFSKENAVMAIPLLLLYDYVFITKFNLRLFMKKILIIAGLGLVSIGLTSYLLGLHHAFIDIVGFFSSSNQPLTRKEWMAIDVYWTPLQHILTEFRVVSRYLFLIFIPLPRLLVFDWWGFPISKGITEPITTLLSIIMLSSLFIFSLWKIKRFPLLCFGILWYFIAISLESFFALGADLYFEHRNYLPVSGLIIGIVGQIVMSFKGQLTERAVCITAIVLCVVLGSLTFSRNFVWKDSIALWEDTLKKAPSNIRAMFAIANVYLKQSDMDNAERYYKEVVKISSNDKRVRFLNESAYGLGMVYLSKNQMEQAKELIDMFENSSESYRPKILRGFYKALNKDVEGALKDYTEVINETEDIDTVVVLTLMGDAYRKKGFIDRAMEHYNKAISLDPGFPAAYYGMGASYMEKRDIEHAEYYINKTLSIDPYHLLALSDMAYHMLIKKSNEKALTYASRAVSKSPPFYQPYLTMGDVLIVLGREKEAEDFYTKALEHGMPDYMVPYLSELQKYKDFPRKN